MNVIECVFHRYSNMEDIQSKAFPMLSTSLFSQNGTIYNQRAVFGTTFSLNETALAEVGLPALTGMCRA